MKRSSADQSIFKTHCISVFDGDKLIAGGYFDTGENSAASILHFFDPEYKRCSLGKYLLLVTVDFLKSAGYSFLYPGYVLAGNTKMDYKLFLGKKVMQYYDAAAEAWKPFQDTILAPEEYSEEDLMEVLLALMV